MTDRTRVDTASDAGRSGDEETVVGVPPAPSRTAAAPRSIARYVVLDEIGRGGMGRVVRAYDPKLMREVALKELRDGSLGDEGRRRLLVEARAMAKLSHPNVVGVYDVEDSVPGKLVVVMEYVAGTTLRQWLQDDVRGHDEIMGSFVAAGRGLAAAHAVGLLHRDFKPANVLVADEGAVKVTDFGLAKEATDASAPSGSGTHEMSDGEELTRAGAVMGTPRYMAPEQHQGQALTAAVDQYAFCVALWEALCGDPPFSGQALGPRKQKGPPAWPNAATPSRIAEATRRGLDPDPAQRWPSMGDLLSALAPRRRRASKARWGGAALAVGLGLWGVAAWTQRPALDDRCTGARAHLAGVWDDRVRARAEAAMLSVDRRFATGAWRHASEVLDQYAGDWVSSYEEACAATTLRREQSAEVMELRMACLHRVRTDLAAVTARLAAADADVVLSAHVLVDELPSLQRCDDVATLTAGAEPPAPAIADEVAEVRAAIARIETSRRLTHSEGLRAHLEDTKRRVAAIDYPPLHAEFAFAESFALDFLGDYDGALDALERAEGLAAANHDRETLSGVVAYRLYLIAVRRSDPMGALLFRELAEGLAAGHTGREARLANYLGATLASAGRYAEAVVQFERALDKWEEVGGPHSYAVSVALTNLGHALEAIGRSAQARERYLRALDIKEAILGSEHPDVGVVLDGLGRNARAAGDSALAESHTRRALRLRTDALGAEHPSVADTRNNLGLVLTREGNLEEALVELRAAHRIREATSGADSTEAAATRTNLARTLWKLGRKEEAVELARGAYETYRAVGASEHPNALSARVNLASMLSGMGDHETAETELRAAIEDLRSALGENHAKLATARGILAEVLQTQGKLEAAEAMSRAGVQTWLRAVGEDHTSVAWSRCTLATILRERGRVDEALAVVELAWQRLSKPDVPAHDRAKASMVVAKAQWAAAKTRDERQRARQSAELALKAYREAGPRHEEAQAQVQAWLRERPRP